MPPRTTNSEDDFGKLYRLCQYHHNENESMADAVPATLADGCFDCDACIERDERDAELDREREDFGADL